MIKLSLFKLLAPLALAPLIVAYGAQYYGMEPCQLCIYQRLPYWIISIVCIASVFFDNKLKFCGYLLIMLSLICSVLLAGFHFGVEHRWIAYHSSCTFSQANSLAEYKQIIASAALVACDVPTAFFLNISMAGWNLVYSVSLMLFYIYLLQNDFKRG
jgi:disulfide bond formation protein DsbB